MAGFIRNVRLHTYTGLSDKGDTMRKLIALMIAAGLVLAFSLQSPAMAQEAPGANELEAVAKEVRAGLVAPTPSQLYDKLTPGRKGQIDMLQARAKRAVANGQLSWKDLDKTLHRKDGLDPAKKLGLKDATAFTALTPAQFCCLFLGLYRVAADEGLAARMKDQWFMTRRAVGAVMIDMDVKRDPLTVLTETGGEVRYESIDGLKVRVTCIAEGLVWLVHDITLEVPKQKFTLSEQLSDANKFVMGPNEEARKAKAGEGEQLLGSMKNHLRVAYAKINSIPDKLVGAVGSGGCGVVEDELLGKYYKCRDTVYVARDTKYALAAEPVNEADLWVALFGDAMNARDDTIKHYDSKAALDEALAEFGAASKKEEDRRNADVEAAWKLYKTKGNKWTLKSTTKMAGMDDMVTYLDYEVTEVTEGGCKLKMTILDKDRKEMAPANETPIKFTRPDPARADSQPPRTRTSEESVTVEAGTFDCVKTTYGEGENETTTWMHKEFAGLIVKMATKMTSMELVKFDCK